MPLRRLGRDVGDYEDFPSMTIDAHDPAGMAAFLRERAKANREIAALPPEEWPHRPEVLRHWALRFEQAATMIERLHRDADCTEDLAKALEHYLSAHDTSICIQSADALRAALHEHRERFGEIRNCLNAEGE